MTAMVTGPDVATLGEGVDALADTELLQRLRAVEALSRQAHGVMLGLVGELQARNLAGQAGFGTTQRMLSRVLLLSQGEARARVRTAEQLAPRRAVTGEELPARCSATAAGLAAGAIGPAQARIITETMTRIPDSTGLEDRDAAEQELADWAPKLDPAGLSRLATRILAHLDPDGPEPDAADKPAPSGGLRLRDRHHGGVRFDGWLDGEHGPALRELIEHLATPGRPATASPTPAKPRNARPTPWSRPAGWHGPPSSAPRPPANRRT